MASNRSLSCFHSYTSSSSSFFFFFRLFFLDFRPRLFEDKVLLDVDSAADRASRSSVRSMTHSKKESILMQFLQIVLRCALSTELLTLLSNGVEILLKTSTNRVLTEALRFLSLMMNMYRGSNFDANTVPMDTVSDGPQCRSAHS